MNKKQKSLVSWGKTALLCVGVVLSLGIGEVPNEAVKTDGQISETSSGSSSGSVSESKEQQRNSKENGQLVKKRQNHQKNKPIEVIQNKDPLPIRAQNGFPTHVLPKGYEVEEKEQEEKRDSSYQLIKASSNHQKAKKKALDKKEKNLIEEKQYEANKFLFLNAAKSGKVKEVKKFIKEFGKRAEEATTDFPYKGMNALHLAAYAGHTALVELLIKEYKFNPEALTTARFNVLHLAARAGSEKVAKALQRELDKRTFSKLVKRRNNNGRNPLHLAAQGGHQGMVELFIRGNKEDLLLSRDNWGRNVYHLAAKEGYQKTLEFLMGLKVKNQNDLFSQDSYGRNVLHLTAQKGHLSVVKFLIEKNYGKALKSPDFEGKTALHLACQYNQREVVKYLVKSCRMDPLKASNNQFNALHWASWAGSSKVVKLLVEDLATDPSMKDGDGDTALDLARQRGHQHIVAYLSPKLAASIDRKKVETQDQESRVRSRQGKLDFSKQGVLDGNADCVASSLKAKSLATVIKEILSVKDSVQVVDLTGNNLTLHGAKRVLWCVEGLPSVERLSIASNLIDGGSADDVEEFNELLEGVLSKETVKEVDIRYNELVDDSWMEGFKEYIDDDSLLQKLVWDE